MVTVEFDSMGEAVRLALVAGEYVGGGLAVLLLDATDPRSEGYMAECVSSRGFEQKEHRKLSSLSIGSAHAF